MALALMAPTRATRANARSAPGPQQGARGPSPRARAGAAPVAGERARGGRLTPGDETKQGDSGKHTILLLQPTNNKTSRTFMDYETVAGAMDGVCGMFEKELKRLNPNLRNITYDISDLYRYIDNLADLSALVYHPQLNAYIPCNRDWIKQRAFQHLKRMAT